MPGLQDIPDDQPISSTFPGQATAGTAIEQVLFRAPFRCRITAVEFTPNTTQAGANTNSFTLNVRNRAAGAGTAVPATLAFVAGVDLTATTPRTIPVSGTPAALLLNAGDVITAEKAIVGTGLAGPAGAITVHILAA
jgi:hypothetical protein